MERIAYPFTITLPLLAALALASPSGAASGALSLHPEGLSLRTPVILAQATPTQTPAPSTGAPAAPSPRADRVEARIKALHDELKITSAQEDQWKNVTQVMRDNANTMQALTKVRRERAKTMSALDDLKSYAEITEAHVDGLKKFIPAFEPLYNSMSDEQKKTADTVFRSRGRQRTASKSTAPKSN
jgi:periplasmic protein CpxP/Spy